MENIGLRYDHSVFGRMVVSQQSTRHVKEFVRFRNKESYALAVPKQCFENHLRDIYGMNHKHKELRRTKSYSAECSVDLGKLQDRNVETNRACRFAWMRSNSHESSFTPAGCLNGNSFIKDTQLNKSFQNCVNSEISVHKSSVKTTCHPLPPTRRKTFHGRLISESSFDEEEERRKSTTDLLDCNIKRRSVSELVDELLIEIYGKRDGYRRYSSVTSSAQESDCYSTSGASTSGWRRWGYQSLRCVSDREGQRNRLRTKDLCELTTMAITLRMDVQHVCSKLIKELKRREKFMVRRDKSYDIITAFLQAHSEKRRAISAGISKSCSAATEPPRRALRSPPSPIIEVYEEDYDDPVTVPTVEGPEVVLSE